MDAKQTMLVIEALNIAISATMDQYLETKIGTPRAVELSKKAHSMSVLRDYWVNKLNTEFAA